MGGTAVSNHRWKNRKSLSVTCCGRATCSSEERKEREEDLLSAATIFPREASYLLCGDQREDQPREVGHGGVSVQRRPPYDIAEQLAHLLWGQTQDRASNALPSL